MSLSLFNFSYIDGLLPLTKTATLTDLDTVPPSSCVYSKYNTDKYSLPSPIDIGLLLILTMMILPTILLIVLIIISTMLLSLLVVIGTHEDHNVLSDGINMTTAKPPTELMTILLTTFPLLPPHMLNLLSLTRNQVKGENSVYNDGCVGPSSKNYTTLVLVAIALNSNGLLQSCTNYQWQSGLFGSFIMTVCACQHWLGSFCLASYNKLFIVLSFPLLPSLFLFFELCCT